MKLFGLFGMCSVVVADPLSYPSAWWSGSKILAGNKKYVTDSMLTDDIVAAFSKDSNLLVSSDASAPEVIALVVCDQLKHDDFLPGGAMKSLENVIARSKSSVLIPLTVVGAKNVQEMLAASAARFSNSELNLWSIGPPTDSKSERHFGSVKQFLAAAKQIFSNGKTDFLLVSLPTKSADQAVNKLDMALNKLTAGNYLAAVLSEQTENVLHTDKKGAPAARKLFGLKSQSGLVDENRGLRITPEILLAVILTFIMLIFLYIGLCGMMGFGKQDQFWPPHKADRPLKGKIES